MTDWTLAMQALPAGVVLLLILSGRLIPAWVERRRLEDELLRLDETMDRVRAMQMGAVVHIVEATTQIEQIERARARNEREAVASFRVPPAQFGDSHFEAVMEVGTEGPVGFIEIPRVRLDPELRNRDQFGIDEARRARREERRDRQARWAADEAKRRAVEQDREPTFDELVAIARAELEAEEDRSWQAAWPEVDDPPAGG